MVEELWEHKMKHIFPIALLLLLFAALVNENYHKNLVRPHQFEFKQVKDRLGNEWFVRENTENGQICVMNLHEQLWIELDGPGASIIYGCGSPSPVSN
jgi:hypothetical protein